MKRNSVKVCVRTRPTHNFAQDNITLDLNENTIQVSQGHSDAKESLVNNKQNVFKFKFDQVFHNASQSDLYDTFARDTVQGVVDGVNGAIMSYGQTGSGKSFTMVCTGHSNKCLAPNKFPFIFVMLIDWRHTELRASRHSTAIYQPYFQ